MIYCTWVVVDGVSDMGLAESKMKIDSADIAGIAPIKFFVNFHQDLEIYPHLFVQFYQKCLESR